MTLTDATMRRGTERVTAAETRKAAMTSTYMNGTVPLASRHRQEQPRGVAAARSLAFDAKMAATPERRGDKDFYKLVGHASVVNVKYEMWDEFGPYWEEVGDEAWSETLASDPDVVYLANHRGLSMARTTNGTLTITMDDVGPYTEAWLNPTRRDVQDLVSAVDDKLVTEMSFAFMLEDGKWSEDFTTFRITKLDINRGDVSAVNYGANPYTDVTARQRELMADLDRLPVGAARAAVARLQRRIPTLDEVARRAGVTGGLTRKSTAASHAGRLAKRLARTSDRLIEHAERTGTPLAALPAVRLAWYTVRNADGGGSETSEPGTATVFLFDEIGGSMGVDAKSFVDEIEAITAPVIKLRINSPGGSVRDAVAMHSALLHHPARVLSYVDSLAASAASVVAMAGDEIVMMPGAQMMLHDASMVEDGNADDMRKAATFLDRQSGNVADIYARRGNTAEYWRDLMLAETWVFAQEAVDLGLADRIEGGRSSGDVPMEAMDRSHDLSHFRYAGRRAAPPPPSRDSQSLVLGLDGLQVRETSSPAATDLMSVATGRSIALIEALLSDD